MVRNHASVYVNNATIFSSNENYFD
jgi:hypothetical protein